MDICKEVWLLSKLIRNWVSKQPSVKEESLTDWLLFQMSERVENIIYRAFTRMEEAKTTGADWEWWFVFPKNINFKMRVQAKKIFCDNYSHIAYTNQYGLQIEKLLRDALDTNSIPLYAFYTSEAGNVMCCKNRNDEGVFIAGANNLYKSFISGGRKKVTPKDILANSNALSCFFCCPLANSGSNLGDFFQEYYKFENTSDIGETLNEKSDNYNSKSMLGIHESLPGYVLSLLGKEKIDLQLVERQYKRDITGINAILICDFSEKNRVK